MKNTFNMLLFILLTISNWNEHTANNFRVNFVMPLCGQKTATACGLLSIWGIVQLSLLGVASYLRSPALIEDIDIPER